MFRTRRVNKDAGSIHLNYVTQRIDEKDKSLKHLEIDPYSEDHVCCSDVWKGFCCGYNKGEKGVSMRDCTKEETYQLNFVKVFVKQMTSLVLFSLILWYIYITTELRDSSGFGSFFVCDPDDENSFLSANEELQEDFSDDGVQFCYFKHSLVLLSFILLFPYLLETFSVLTIIWVSSINNNVLVPIVDGKYVGSAGNIDHSNTRKIKNRHNIFDNVHSNNPFARAFYSIWALFAVPLNILELNAMNEAPVATHLLLAEMIWKLVVFMLPDLLLTIMLFPVSYYVMQTSETPEDIFVNLVALQVFAEIDDIFVKMLANPRVSCGETIFNYVDDNPNADKATYNPFQAYSMNENRHEMGLKVKQMPQMKHFHEYDGHRLVD